MKKLCSLSLAIFVLSGCSYSNADLETKSKTSTEQLCSELKRNIVFNTASGPNIGGAASATQQAQMLHLYDKYDCSKLEKQKSGS